MTPLAYTVILSFMANDIALPEKPLTMARTNSRGLIEIIDMHTGRVLCVQASNEDLLKSKWDRLTKIETDKGPVWIEKGLSFDLIHAPALVYSEMLADLLCEKIANGATLVEACAVMNLPYSEIRRWRRVEERFRNALAEVEKDRAALQRDEVIHEARKADTKTKIAALQWAAEKDDPEKFGTKTKVVGGDGGPVIFKLDTGIRRDIAAPTEGATREVTPERTAEEISTPGIGD